MSTASTGQEWLQGKGKRGFDLLFASTMSTVATPLAFAALTALMIENRQPPLFLQERVGKPGEALSVPKMRTLRGPVQNTASNTGHVHERAGATSQLLRSLHIDELPQLALVMRGTMSVVGPQPIVGAEFDTIMGTLSVREQKEWREARTGSKPGLVNRLSIAQHTPGYQNNPRDVAEADIRYYHTASAREDARIITGTLQQVLGDIGVRYHLPLLPHITDSGSHSHYQGFAQ